MSTPARNHLSTAEQRLHELGFELPAPPEPFGVYAEVVQTGNLLFLTGMLPTDGRSPKFVGRLGAELNLDEARQRPTSQPPMRSLSFANSLGLSIK